MLEKPLPYRVESVQCGVRPATIDRKPVVAWHPRMPNVGLFNGFGSKGALLIPYFAQRLTDNLIDGTALPTATNYERFEGR
jgi:glycine/D-amino acid oxidase-like deaminating enzyme